MTQRVHHPFPLAQTLMALSGAALLAGALSVWLAGAWDESATAVRAAVAMAVVSWGVAVTVILPVAVAGPMGVMPTVAAYFGGALARIVITILVAVLAIKLLHLPRTAVAVSLLVMYLPLLFVEAGLVARYLWAKDALPAGPDPNTPAISPQPEVSL